MGDGIKTHNINKVFVLKFHDDDDYDSVISIVKAYCLGWLKQLHFFKSETVALQLVNREVSRAKYTDDNETEYSFQIEFLGNDEVRPFFNMLVVDITKMCRDSSVRIGFKVEEHNDPNR